MDIKQEVVNLAQKLIQQPSQTPNDADCKQIILHALNKDGNYFTLEDLSCQDVTNYWLKQENSTSGKQVFFAGHTDVVPADEQGWLHQPFAAHLDSIDGVEYLYGRGAADMKGGIAAMLVASRHFIKENPNYSGGIHFILTSDEEGIAKYGTKVIVEHLIQQKQKIDYCIIGEPSSHKTVGDTIKNGRRGSLSAHLTINGKQGHVAYPHLADNPIHAAANFVQELIATKWDNGNEYFPATSLQITNIKTNTDVSNVIPGNMELKFNLRFSSEIDAETIKDTVKQLLEQHTLSYSIAWHLSGNPFITAAGHLTDCAKQAIQEIQDIEPELSTSGGTSDGRFITKIPCQLIELGLLNASIHQVNEKVATAELLQLTKIYKRLLEKLLT